MENAIEVAGYGTAFLAVCAITCFGLRFQTRFIGMILAFCFLQPYLLPTSTDTFTTIVSLLSFSSLLSMHKLHHKQHYIAYILLVLVDVYCQHYYWPICLSIGVSYTARVFPLTWRVWSLFGILVYLWPGLLVGWIPVGYMLLVATERCVWYQCVVAANKKII